MGRVILKMLSTVGLWAVTVISNLLEGLTAQLAYFLSYLPISLYKIL
jgi:hypothetical protein